MPSVKFGTAHTNGYKTATNKWIDKKEVIDNMGICARTLQNWRSKGIIPHYRMGGIIYYRESDLETMIEKNIHTTVKKKK